MMISLTKSTQCATMKLLAGTFNIEVMEVIRMKKKIGILSEALNYLLANDATKEHDDASDVHSQPQVTSMKPRRMPRFWDNIIDREMGYKLYTDGDETSVVFSFPAVGYDRPSIKINVPASEDKAWSDHVEVKMKAMKDERGYLHNDYPTPDIDIAFPLYDENGRPVKVIPGDSADYTLEDSCDVGFVCVRLKLFVPRTLVRNNLS